MEIWILDVLILASYVYVLMNKYVLILIAHLIQIIAT